MPNGGRKGDNPQSWFLDGICRDGQAYLGDPIDGLICEIYRLTGDEDAPGVRRTDDKDEFDLVELEAELRRKLEALKA